MVLMILNFKMVVYSKIRIFPPVHMDSVTEFIYFLYTIT